MANNRHDCSKCKHYLHTMEMFDRLEPSYCLRFKKYFSDDMKMIKRLLRCSKFKVKKRKCYKHIKMKSPF